MKIKGHCKSWELNSKCSGIKMTKLKKKKYKIHYIRFECSTWFEHMPWLAEVSTYGGIRSAIRASGGCCTACKLTAASSVLGLPSPTEPARPIFWLTFSSKTFCPQVFETSPPLLQASSSCSDCFRLGTHSCRFATDRHWVLPASSIWNCLFKNTND